MLKFPKKTFGFIPGVPYFYSICFKYVFMDANLHLFQICIPAYVTEMLGIPLPDQQYSLTRDLNPHRMDCTYTK